MPSCSQDDLEDDSLHTPSEYKVEQLLIVCGAPTLPHLNNLTATCQQRAIDFESRQQSHVEERVVPLRAVRVGGISIALSASRHTSPLIWSVNRAVGYEDLSCSVNVVSV